MGSPKKHYSVSSVWSHPSTEVANDQPFRDDPTTTAAGVTENTHRNKTERAPLCLTWGGGPGYPNPTVPTQLYIYTISNTQTLLFCSGSGRAQLRNNPGDPQHTQPHIALTSPPSTWSQQPRTP